MIWHCISALAVCALAAVCIWLARGRLLTPVAVGAGDRLCVVIDASGSAYELENTVEGLLWLNGNGTLRAEILVRDCGMDSAARAAAAILARRGKVRLLPPDAERIETAEEKRS